MGKEHPGKNCTQEERKRKCFRLFLDREDACRECLEYEKEYRRVKEKIDAERLRQNDYGFWLQRRIEQRTKKNAHLPR